MPNTLNRARKLPKRNLSAVHSSGSRSRGLLDAVRQNNKLLTARLVIDKNAGPSLYLWISALLFQGNSDAVEMLQPTEESERK